MSNVHYEYRLLLFESCPFFLRKVYIQIIMALLMTAVYLITIFMVAVSSSTLFIRIN